MSYMPLLYLVVFPVFHFSGYQLYRFYSNEFITCKANSLRYYKLYLGFITSIVSMIRSYWGVISEQVRAG